MWLKYRYVTLFSNKNDVRNIIENNINKNQILLRKESEFYYTKINYFKYRIKKFYKRLYFICG